MPDQTVGKHLKINGQGNGHTPVHLYSRVCVCLPSLDSKLFFESTCEPVNNRLNIEISRNVPNNSRTDE